MIKKLIICLIAILTVTSNCQSSTRITEPIQNSIHHWTANSILNIFKRFGAATVKQVYDNIKNGIQTKITCTICKLAFKLTKHGIYSTNELHYLFYESCSTFHFETERVCQGLANLFSEEVYFILTHSNLSSDEVCGIIVGAKCLDNPRQAYGNWTVDLPKPNIKRNTFNSDISRKVKNSLRILHLADVHIDPWYLPGGHSDCGEPLCCRATSSKGKTSKTAGYWGDYYSCDAPENTIIQLFTFINQTLTQQYDVLIWTGDASAHDVWNNTKSSVINGTRLLSSLIKYNLANYKFVLPAIGNHEGFPVNQFAPPQIDNKFSSKWLYEELWNQWNGWIPNEYDETFKVYGYYSTNITTELKAIVLNTNYCSRLNFWLLYSSTDPGNQLKWLVNELHQAESIGQMVYIIGHIAIDTYQCAPFWVHNYLKIIERYQNTISAQFFGHTHFDEIKIYYKNGNGNGNGNGTADDKKPMSIGYLGPSVTTYDQLNPAFRFYQLDQYGKVIDHETYFMNLTKANKMRSNDTLKWIKEYNVKQAYGMASLEPNDWDLFYHEMQTDDDLFNSYYNHYHRYSDAFPSQCQTTCKTDILSSIQIFDPVS